MKPMMIFTFVAALTSFAFFTNTAEAADRDLCICQTGSAPSDEIKYFNLGCKTWNMTQSCSEKITISLDDSIADVLSTRPDVKSVKIGYVGHWSSAHETTQFLKEQIVPVIKKRDIYFDIHNSACLAVDDPYIVRDYFKKIGKAAKSIHFYGNQVVSTGGWDPILPGKNNFWASINGASLKVEFPDCKEFELKECMKTFQAYADAVCFDSKANKYVVLECTENSRIVTKTSSNLRGSSTRKVTQTRFEWVQSNSGDFQDARRKFRAKNLD